MKRIALSFLSLFMVFCCFGQSSIRQILMEIEQNNPELKAAAAEMEAEKIAGKAEARLANPEVEFNYLRGADNIGDRHDLRVIQSFDVPTLAGMKAGMARDIGELALLRYKTTRQSVLLEALQTCIDLVFWDAFLDELRNHQSQSDALVEAYERRLKAGESTILDLNKARIHQTSVRGQITRAETERQTLLSALRTLNGGLPVAPESLAYDLSEDLPDHFDRWFAEASDQSPMLAFVRKQVELEERQVAIDRASAFPELAVGYMSEIRPGEKFRGVTVGIHLPLWNAGYKVRKSRAQAEAAAERRNAAEQEFYIYLQNQYSQARSLKENAEMMRRSLLETDNRGFLFSALSKGEISMVEYLVETDLYYDASEATLEAERDYHHALAALNAYTL